MIFCEIQDIVLFKGTEIFLLFLRGQSEIALTRGGIKSCIYEGTMPVLTMYMKESLCCCLFRDIHWRTLKTQKMKNIIFSIQNIFCLLWQIKTDDSDTLLLSIPNTDVLKDTGYRQLWIAGLLCFARGVSTNQWNRTVYHFTCSLWVYMFKKTAALVL